MLEAIDLTGVVAASAEGAGVGELGAGGDGGKTGLTELTAVGVL